MAELRMEEKYPILPARITHNSEQLWNGNELEQNYNYLVYEFETEQHRYRARAYLDEIRAVAVYGPFEKDFPSPNRLEGIEIDQRVLAYLRRRFVEIRINT
jgi:hypothetical protein